MFYLVCQNDNMTWIDMTSTTSDAGISFLAQISKIRPNQSDYNGNLDFSHWFWTQVRLCIYNAMCESFISELTFYTSEPFFMVLYTYWTIVVLLIINQILTCTVLTSSSQTWASVSQPEVRGGIARGPS